MWFSVGMSLKLNQIYRLIELGKTDLGYKPEKKDEFHFLAKKYAKDLAVALKLPQGSFDIRSNKAGIAVSGEVTLHGEWVYVQFGHCCVMPHQFMWRLCKGRKDYTGLQNQWAKWDEISDIHQLAKKILDVYHYNKSIYQLV